jgi:transketolase
MRSAFIEAMIELAAADNRVYLLTADLGWRVVEPYAEKYKERFLNVGVAEANMAGVAAGLAQAGYVPFIYSIATFTSMRCYEQVRNGALLHHLPVRVVGIGGGYAYGHAGPTHFALEDLTIARTQPGMTVLAPADPQQTRAVVRATMEMPGPVYLRIGKGGNPEVPGLNGRFRFNEPEIVREGKDVLFIACGGVVHEAFKAASTLESEGLSCAVAVQAHLPYVAGDELVSLLKKFKYAVSVEEGYAVGGLGSLIAETIAQHGIGCRLHIAGIKKSFSGVSGSDSYMRAQVQLDPASLANAVRKLISNT